MKIEGAVFRRGMILEMRAADPEKREIALSFSSETEEVRRYFGIEILDHRPESVMLDRLRQAGSLIFHHDPLRIIGAVREAWVESGRGRARVGVDDTEEGNLALKRIESGSLRGTSVGYRVHSVKTLAAGEKYVLGSGREVTGRDDIDVVIATRWEPVEISLTAVPYDPGVGVGRGAEFGDSVKENEEENMDEKRVQEIVQEALRGALPGMVQEIRTALRPPVAPPAPGPVMQRIAPEEAIELTGRASAISPECKGIAADMIFAGKTKEEVTRFLFEEFTKARKPDARDPGPDGTDGSGIRPQGDDSAGPPAPTARSLKTVSDEDFIAGICNPRPGLM